MTDLPKQAILVVNAKSRQGADAFAQAREKLTAAGVELIDAVAVPDPAQMDDAVKGAIGRAPMVIVGGGDGSLSSNVDFFLGTDTVFAALPLGTANSFARTVGIPLDLDGAVGVIARGERRRIDLGCVNGDYFVNAAALGLSPLIARSVPHQLKRWLGKLGYLLWALRCSLRFKPFRLTVEQAGRRETVWATEVRIANGTHHGGVELVEDHAIDDGEMVVQAVVGRSVLGLARDWLGAVLRLSSRQEKLREWRGQRMRIETRPVLDISIDGELAARTPAEISLARGAIDVAAPRSV